MNLEVLTCYIIKVISSMLDDSSTIRGVFFVLLNP